MVVKEDDDDTYFKMITITILVSFLRTLLILMCKTRRFIRNWLWQLKCCMLMTIIMIANYITREESSIKISSIVKRRIVIIQTKGDAMANTRTCSEEHSQFDKFGCFLSIA